MQKFHIIESALLFGILCSVFFISGVFAQSPGECSCTIGSGDGSYPDPCLCQSDESGDNHPSVCSCPFSPSKVTLPACCSCVFGPSCSRTSRFQAGDLKVNFSANVTSGPAPLAVQFSDRSTGSLNGWAWDFGDGGVSSEQNPVHVYLNPGTYSVSLTISRFYSSASTSFSESRGISKPGYIVVTGVPAVIQENNLSPIPNPEKNFASRMIESRNGEVSRVLIKYQQSRSSGITRVR